MTTYLIGRNMAAKKYTAAAEIAHTARGQHPDDLRLATARSAGAAAERQSPIRALRRWRNSSGEARRRSDRVHRAGAGYTDADRGAQAVKVLQDAPGEVPRRDVLTFELGAVLDKQKKFAERRPCSGS